MIWAHNVRAVVMCTNLIEAGKNKCAKYWPDAGKTMSYGAVKVSHMETKFFQPDFVINLLRAECGQETRTISHFHYLTWPDHGVPSVGFLTHHAALRSAGGGGGGQQS